MNLYLDTSALVKLSIDEEWHQLAKPGVEDAAVVMTSVIAYAECRSAFPRRHRAGDIDLRGFDAIHLATALRTGETVGSITFLYFDNRLNDAARMVSLRVLGGRPGRRAGWRRHLIDRD